MSSDATTQFMIINNPMDGLNDPRMAGTSEYHCYASFQLEILTVCIQIAHIHVTDMMVLFSRLSFIQLAAACLSAYLLMNTLPVRLKIGSKQGYGMNHGSLFLPK
jgi:hypothetical protein